MSHSSVEHGAGSRLRAFLSKHALSSVDELVQQAAEAPSWYWGAVANWLNLEWFSPFYEILATVDSRRSWFVNGTCNLTHLTVDRHAAVAPSRLALIEHGPVVRRLTYDTLARYVNRVGNALASLSVGPGTAVALMLPPRLERIIATLACAKLGAVCIPISLSGSAAQMTETAIRAVVESKAHVIITANWWRISGVSVPSKTIADRASVASSATEYIITLPEIDRGISWLDGRDLWWDDIVSLQAESLTTYRARADHPYVVLPTGTSTSATTVHAHAGLSIKLAHDLALIFDVGPQDVVAWFSSADDIWPDWATLAALLLGATVVLPDASALPETLGDIWDIVSQQSVSVLGIDPALLASPGSLADPPSPLATIRLIGSTGRPLTAAQWQWLHKHAGGERVPVLNYYGRGALGGGLLTCTTIGPTKPGAFSTLVPGVTIHPSSSAIWGAASAMLLPNWPGDNSASAASPPLEVIRDSDGFWHVLAKSE